MQITAIKRGQTLEISENLDIPDGQAVRIEIVDARINNEKDKFGGNLEEFRRQHNIAELDIDVDAIFGDVRVEEGRRQEAEGRRFRLNWGFRPRMYEGDSIFD